MKYQKKITKNITYKRIYLLNSLFLNLLCLKLIILIYFLIWVGGLKSKKLHYTMRNRQHVFPEKKAFHGQGGARHRGQVFAYGIGLQSCCNHLQPAHFACCCGVWLASKPGTWGGSHCGLAVAGAGRHGFVSELLLGLIIA